MNTVDLFHTGYPISQLPNTGLDSARQGFFRKIFSPGNTPRRGGALAWLLEVVGIESGQFFDDKQSVPANQRIVEPHLTAPAVCVLQAHHVPMNGASVSIIRLVLVGGSRREMKTARYLLIKEDVHHRARNLGI